MYAHNEFIKKSEILLKVINVTFTINYFHTTENYMNPDIYEFKNSEK